MKKKLLALMGLVLALAPAVTTAALLSPPPDQKPFYDLQPQAFEIITFILRVAGAFAVLAILIGGFLYVSSGGFEDRIKQAKSIITYSVVGLVFIILAYVIMITIHNIVGPKS